MFLFYILGMLAWMGHPQEQHAALHLVVESQFTFLASTQTTITEYWITDDKTYEKRGTRVTISRKDRGVRWAIDTRDGTYSETRLTPAAGNEKTAEDIHTAGFSYEPEFAWTVADGSEAATINGRRCGTKTATGTDAFAEMTLKLWLCDTNRPAPERKANEFVVESARFRYENPTAYATKLLSRWPNKVLMSLEATLEPPTSPTMGHRVMVRTIENAATPAGIFDLPSGVHKTTNP